MLHRTEPDPARFSGFSHGTIDFLLNLRTNNNSNWFHAHRDEYEQLLITPAKNFVAAAGERIRAFLPDIHAEPAILGSIFRINRDTRRAKVGHPYKDHQDFWFWEGERRNAVSGLFIRLSPEFIGIGVGCHRFDKERLALFRRSVASSPGDALVEVAADLEQKGYRLQRQALKRIPKGYEADGRKQRFLLFDSLYVHTDEPVQLAFKRDSILDACVKHWRELAPLHKWIIKFVQYAGPETVSGGH
jgi:uncharacterized protein (TIGR02453 family)